MSASANARLDRANTSRAEVKSRPPRTSTLWKITHTSANSARPAPSVPSTSVTNEVRYCSCARAREASRTRYGRSRSPRPAASGRRTGPCAVVASATLHLQLATAGPHDDLAEGHEHHGPEDLAGESRQ